MKEILVGFIYMGFTGLSVYLCCKYEKLGLALLYGVAGVLIIGAAYLIGAVTLGTI